MRMWSAAREDVECCTLAGEMGWEGLGKGCFHVKRVNVEYTELK